MFNRLPLIPNQEQLCSDVRPILRDVFRELDLSLAAPALPAPLQWEECWREGVARGGDGESAGGDPTGCSREPRAPGRSHLEPRLGDCVGRELVLNTLYGSTHGAYAINTKLPVKCPPARACAPVPVTIRSTTAPLTTHSSLQCIPHEICFVNFVVGRVCSKYLKIINTSKRELRLSLRPPRSPWLQVSPASARGLHVTAGARVAVRVTLLAADRRSLTDVLSVRADDGSASNIRIHCYVDASILHVSMGGTIPYARASSVTIASSTVLDAGCALLGDVRVIELQLEIRGSESAKFFIMTEEKWLNSSLSVSHDTSWSGTTLAAPFAWSPSHWSGSTRALLRCMREEIGRASIEMRVAADTCVTRSLLLVADTTMYDARHVTVQADDMDYDICSDADNACDYYLSLGATSPRRQLLGHLDLANHSAVVYTYYWSVRAWRGLRSSDDVEPLILSPAAGVLSPRRSCRVNVGVCDVGDCAGERRAVASLVLQNIPRESIPMELESRILKLETVNTGPFPGVESHSRCVCEVLSAEVEVRWEVVPPRFLVQPAFALLPHSERLRELDLRFRVTQTSGADEIRTAWHDFPACVTPPIAPCLAPDALTCLVEVHLPLSDDGNVPIDVFVLSSVNGQSSAESRVVRQVQRGAVTVPARVWTGAVPPGTQVRYELEAYNGSSLQVCSQLRALSLDGRDLSLTSSVRLQQWERKMLHYELTAPEKEGAVVHLVEMVGCSVDSRAGLVSGAVVIPQVLLRVEESIEIGHRGTLVNESPQMVRPSAALPRGCGATVWVSFVNIAPVPCLVTCHPSPDDGRALLVSFSPLRVELGAHSRVRVQVTLLGVAVCARRVWACRCDVSNAPRPLYLLVDAAVEGRVLRVEVPCGDRIVSVPWTEQDVAGNERAGWREELQGWTSGADVRSAEAALFPVRLEFRDLPVDAEAERSVTLHNLSAHHARWSAAVLPHSVAAGKDVPPSQGVDDCDDGGLAVCVSPQAGSVRPGGVARLRVVARAHTWGLYRHTLVVRAESMRPLRVPVLTSAVGAPLSVVGAPPQTLRHLDCAAPEYILWFSPSLAPRMLLLRNSACCDLALRLFVLREHESTAECGPLRVLWRFPDDEEYADFDRREWKRRAPLELTLDEDVGVQDAAGYTVQPSGLRVEARGTAAVRLWRHGGGKATLLVSVSAARLDGSEPCRPRLRSLTVRLRDVPNA